MGCDDEKNFDLTFIRLLYTFIYVQLIVLYYLFVHNSMYNGTSVWKRPEGERLSALENKEMLKLFLFLMTICATSKRFTTSPTMLLEIDFIVLIVFSNVG